MSSESPPDEPNKKMKTWKINTQKQNSAYGDSYPETRREITVTTDKLLLSVAEHAGCPVENVVTSSCAEDGKHSFGFIRGTYTSWGADLVE